MITIPTLSELYNQILSDLQTQYGSTIPLFGKIFLRAIAGVQAGKLKLYYLAIGKLQKNIFVDTADPENSGGTLERFGRIKLGRNPFPAQAGQYFCEVTGTVGATIPARTVFKSNDDSLSPGKLFVLDAAFTLATATDTITLRALEAGSDSTLQIGDFLTSTAPIANVNRIVAVLGEDVEPLDSEDLEDYRRKAIEAYQLEPNGGSAGDYRIWAADAQGVEKVYPYARTGYTGEINLFVEATIADSVDGKGTPSAGLLSDVEDVVELDPDVTKPINERGRRPLQVIVNFEPINVNEVDIEIPDFENLTPALQASILTSLENLINGVRPFVAGADTLDSKNDILNVNLIVSAILTVKPGAIFGDVVLMVGGIEYSTFTFLNGEIPHLNSVTYT